MEPASFKTFHCDSHSQTLTTGLEKQWRENQFCDITFKVEGKEFRCHKNVLAACSEYFTSVFTTGFKEKEKDLIILPPAFEIQPFQTLLDYFYSGKLVLSSENAEGVFVLADYIRLIPVLEMATQYLEETLDRSNCIRRFIVADTIEYKRPSGENMEKAAARLIVKDITNESALTDLLELSGKLVSKILTLSSQAQSAEALFLFIIKWVRHDEENRRLFLKDLLPLVPVTGLSFEFFEAHIKSEELLRKNPESLEWVIDSIMPQFTNRKRTASVLPCLPNPVCVPIPQESLFVANWVHPQICYQLQISNATTLPVPKRPQIDNYSAVSHKKRIYLMCGYDTKETFMLEEGRSWAESDVNLYFDRCSPGTIVIEDDLFVIGGHRNGPLNSCAKFNFTTQKRVSLPNMKEGRFWPGIGVFENSIYAASGWSSTIIERFDPRVGRWSVVGNFHSRMNECASATIGNFLYTCDIHDGRIQRFDFRSKRSDQVGSLPVGPCDRYGKYYWITSLNDEMYAARRDGTVLKYDRDSATWSEFCKGLDLLYPIIMPWV